MARRQIQLETKEDRWRFTCPRQHRSWRIRDDHFWCARCAQRRGVRPDFQALRDQKTGELLDREDVEFAIEYGTFDAEIRQGGHL